MICPLHPYTEYFNMDQLVQTMARNHVHKYMYTKHAA